MANLSLFETANSFYGVRQALACHVLPALEDAFNKEAYSAKSTAVVTFLHKLSACLYDINFAAPIIAEPRRLNV
jgi:hypothetical protein